MADLTDAGHCPDEILLALVHGQPVDRAPRAHLEDCTTCRDRWRVLAGEDLAVATLLAELDHPVPDVAWSPRRARRPAASLMRRVLVMTAAAAGVTITALVAMPNSPLRRWIDPLVHPSGVAGGGADPVSASPVPPTSGIAFAPMATLSIRFVREQSAGVVEVVRAADGDVSVQAEGGETAYDVAGDAVTIDNLVPAEAYRLVIPAAVRRLQITIGDRTLWRWPEDSVDTAPGPLVIPIAPPGEEIP